MGITISELPLNVKPIDDDDLIEVAQQNPESETGYESVKVKVSSLINTPFRVKLEGVARVGNSSGYKFDIDLPYKNLIDDEEKYEIRGATFIGNMVATTYLNEEDIDSTSGDAVSGAMFQVYSGYPDGPHYHFWDHTSREWKERRGEYGIAHGGGLGGFYFCNVTNDNTTSIFTVTMLVTPPDMYYTDDYYVSYNGYIDIVPFTVRKVEQ